MKQIYEIDNSIVDLSEIISVSEIKSADGNGYKFFIGLSAGYTSFSFKTYEKTLKERDNLINALYVVVKKTWIVSEWKYEYPKKWSETTKNQVRPAWDVSPCNKKAIKLYCIETGETKEL